MAVSQDVLKKLKENESLQFAIAQGMKKKFRTVTKWIKGNDDMLSSKGVVLIIQEQTGLTEEEILEPASASVM